jgi:hypothetical protein
MPTPGKEGTDMAEAGDVKDHDSNTPMGDENDRLVLLDGQTASNVR